MTLELEDIEPGDDREGCGFSWYECTECAAEVVEEPVTFPFPAAREQATPSSDERPAGRLRHGRRQPINLYWQLGDDPADHDEQVGVVWHEDIARMVVAAVNGSAAREAEVRREADRWHAEADRAHEAMDRVRELCDPRKKPWYVGRDDILEALRDSCLPEDDQ